MRFGNCNGNDAPRFIRKKDGSLERYQRNKIKSAMRKSFISVGEKIEDGELEELAIKAEKILAKEAAVSRTHSTRDDCHRVAPEVLTENGYESAAKSYVAFHETRELVARTLKITSQEGPADITDRMLFIQSTTEEITAPWDRTRISASLEKEYSLAPDLAKAVSKDVENTVVHLFLEGHNYFSTSVIRKIAEVRLLSQGIPVKESALSIPLETLEALVERGSKENSNINANNPEAVNLGIAEYILKQYNLRNIFSEEVANAHNAGEIHVHDLGYPQRVYCSSHSVEYIKKYGLADIVDNLQNKSSPAKSAIVLNGHVQTFLASMQSKYAGALGFGYLNILYSPMLNLPQDYVEGVIEGREVSIRDEVLEELVRTGVLTTDGGDSGKLYFERTGESRKLFELSDKEFKQIAQNLIFSASQNAFSRGSQTLFIDFNIDTGVPGYMQNVPALGPGGKYMIEDSEGNIEFVDEVERFKGKEGDSRNGDVVHPEDGRKLITYGDPRMVKTSQKFAKALIEVWREGDRDGRQFTFPKCDLHVNEGSFTDPDQREVFDAACELASENGSTYFMFDRASTGATLAQCCRLKETVTDMDMLKHPETVRFTGFQNVTINLPQTAYRSRNGLEGTFKNIDDAMELAVQAHFQKKKYTQSLLDNDGMPLRSLGKPSDDGKQYLDLEKATYIIGLIGLNEAVQYLTGKELHEDKEAFEVGLRIIDRMYQNIQSFKKKHGLKFTIEETPAESATQKLAKGDAARFPESMKVIKGDLEHGAPFYTNSIHLNPGAEVSMIDRIELQSRFHEMIESGAIIHVYCGENQIPADSIGNLVKKAFENTRCSQLTVSPEFTHCNCCHSNYRGFKDSCEKCGSEDVKQRTKIVGYFSDKNNWSASQLEISSAREQVAGHYADLSPGAEWIYDGVDGAKVLVFGRQGCSMCHDAKTHLSRAIEEQGVDVPVEFCDLTQSDDRVKAAMNNISFDPIPTVLFKEDGRMQRYDPQVRRGKIVIRRPEEYKAMVEGFFANAD